MRKVAPRRPHSSNKDRVRDREKSVICECLVQLSVAAVAQEVREALPSINNTLRGPLELKEPRQQRCRCYCVG